MSVEGFIYPGLEEAHPFLQEHGTDLCNEYNVQNIPWVLRVTRCLSSTDTQRALYAQGRLPLAQVNFMRTRAGLPAITEKENSRQVTALDGIDKVSKHQGVPDNRRLVSLAFDVVPSQTTLVNGLSKVIVNYSDVNLFYPLGPLSTKHNLTWGGYWAKRDMPHIEMNSRSV